MHHLAVSLVSPELEPKACVGDHSVQHFANLVPVGTNDLSLHLIHILQHLLEPVQLLDIPGCRVKVSMH